MFVVFVVMGDVSNALIQVSITEWQ